METNVNRTIAWGAAWALWVVLGNAGAYPVVSGSPERVHDTFTSNYQDGYSSAAGVFTNYFVAQADGTWGASQELRALTPALRAGLANHTVLLAGYSLIDGSASYYGQAAGQNGADLVAHRANFGGARGYSIWFDGQAVNVDVQIQFDFTRSGLDAAGQTAFSKRVENSIEGWWNGTFHISKDNGLFNFGLNFDVTFDGDNGHGETVFDHVVKVLADPTNTVRSNEDTFSAAANAATLAHEFGHMLGLYDEYWAGALDSGNGCAANNALCVTDYTGLMGTTALAFGAGMKSGYYSQFAAWLDGQDADPAQTYAIVDEPGTLALIALSLTVLLRPRRAGRPRDVKATVR